LVFRSIWSLSDVILFVGVLLCPWLVCYVKGREEKDFLIDNEECKVSMLSTEFHQDSSILIFLLVAGWELMKNLWHCLGSILQ
jgi:hypothetical protein